MLYFGKPVRATPPLGRAIMGREGSMSTSVMEPQDEEKRLKVMERNLGRYQDAVEKHKERFDAAVGRRDEAIRLLTRNGMTHDQIVQKLGHRLSRGRIGQIAEPKRGR